MFKTLKTMTAACALLAAASTIHTARADTMFDQGVRDRAGWEQWFNGLQGDYKTGAFFWAGERSKPNPGNCQQMNADFYQGCTAAKLRLAATDALRKTEPTYKLGWNAPLTVVPMVPANLPSCSTVPAGSPCVEPAVPVMPASAEPEELTPEQATGECAPWVGGNAYYDGTTFRSFGTAAARFHFEKCLHDHGMQFSDSK